MIITEYVQTVIIRSDNRLCYASKEFKQIMEWFQIDHITTSTHYPQSNGFAESVVKLSKQLMEHSTLDGNPGIMDCLNSDSHPYQELSHHLWKF